MTTSAILKISSAISAIAQTSSRIRTANSETGPIAPPASPSAPIMFSIPSATNESERTPLLMKRRELRDRLPGPDVEGEPGCGDENPQDDVLGAVAVGRRGEDAAATRVDEPER